MGRGIAYVAALGGYRTIIHDVSGEALERALELAAATRRPDRVLGMHFFNPVPKMKLVEIVRAPETGEAAVATVTEVARRMVDLVGLDTRLAVLEFLHQRLGEKYRPAPLLVEHVKAGRLGRKVGRGVYDYPGGE